MAILKSVFEEPLLSRQHSAVLRDIARAAYLNQGLIEINKVIATGESAGSLPSSSQYREVKDFLKTEITKVLTQIKIPAKSSVIKATTKPTE